MSALRPSTPPAAYAIFAYVILLPIFLLLAAFIWAEKVSGVLYSCADSVGILDFIPPFEHPNEIADVYYVPAWRVYLVWYLLVSGAILLPALMVGALWFKWRKGDEYDT